MKMNYTVPTWTCGDRGGAGWRVVEMLRWKHNVVR